MVRIDAYIARHFWRNGEYAVWQADGFFPASLLGWLKSNYAELVAGSRAQWIERPEGTVWLFFHDEHEIHGRMATRLTACWVGKSVSNINAIYVELKKQDDLMQDDILSVPVHARIIHQQRSFTKLIVMIIGLLLIGGVGYKFWIGSVKLPSIEPETLFPQVIIKHGASKPKLNEHHEVSHNMIPKDSICNDYNNADGFCFQKFILEKCNKNTFLTYDAWLKALKTHERARFSGMNCPKGLKHDADFTEDIKHMSKSEQTTIKKFMKQGKR